MSRSVLLVTAGLFHPPWAGRRRLHATLQELPDFTFTHCPSLNALPGSLAAYSALVLHYHHRTLTAPAWAVLENFVRQGGGVLAVHAATASFKRHPGYGALLGGQFAGHGPVQRLRIQPVSEPTAPFAGLSGFEVQDELYRHTLQPGLTVHFTAEQAGVQVPVIWTRSYGQGRVCYCGPGHTTGTMHHPAYQAIVQRALEWVSP